MPFDHFGRVAGLYDRATGFEVSDELLHILDLSPESQLLDVGGGTGRIAFALRRMVKNAMVVDPSQRMLHFAKKRELDAVCAPAESLPFADNKFDRIIMVDALHHLYSQDLAADELWRVLNSEGRILIIEPDIQRFFVKLIALGEKVLLMRSHFLTHEKIMALFGDKRGHVRVFKANSNVMVLVEKVR